MGNTNSLSLACAVLAREFIRTAGNWAAAPRDPVTQHFCSLWAPCRPKNEQKCQATDPRLA